MTDTTFQTAKGMWRAVAEAIRKRRRELATALMNSVADWDKYKPAIDACGPDKTPFLTLEIYAFVDYLALYFDTGDENYRHLYVGEKLKQLYVPNQDAQSTQARKESITSRDTEGTLQSLRETLSNAELNLFETTMRQIASIITSVNKVSAKVLMIGDCLHLDVMGFLAAGCLADGITVEPTFVTDKTAAQVRRNLKDLAAAGNTYDLILYSPFTYAFSLTYAQLLSGKFAMKSTAAITTVVNEAWKEVEGTLNALGDLFEGTIIVHNSANILRHGDTSWERIKHRLTAATRRTSRNLMNQRLAAYITKKNADTFEHFVLLDEAALAEREGEFELGRYFYFSQLQHPAKMGKAIAEIYRDLILVKKRFATKKLVVCDLDNTLWAGVIGEGPVVHHLDRQQHLLQLRKKGVVLAVNSKNDPKNVKWNGSALTEADFVNMQINWDPKVSNFKRIKEALNLGYKDYVFLDDRADERSMAATAYPELLVLDPEDPRTWRLIKLWEQMLPSQAGGGDLDRTAFYKSRETRNQFLESKGLSEDDDLSAAFTALGITVKIRQAGKADLKRVAELINRTNQFNMQGSRTTLKEMQSWHESPVWKIYLADAGDKFGPMGTVSVLISHDADDRIEIPIFVLSCRVFGYGIEDALLNHVKREAAGKPVTGLFKETPSNAPCRETYPKNGFAKEGETWRFTGTSGPDPAWLTISTE